MPLIPEKKLVQMIKQKAEELGVSQRRLNEELAIPQSLISRGFKDEREFKYGELESIVQLLLTKFMVIPVGLKAIDYSSSNVTWVYDDEKVSQVAKLMLVEGYTQIPVRGRQNGRWVGLVTDLSLLKKLMPRRSGEAAAFSLEDLKVKTIREAEVIEASAECPFDVPLHVAAQMLMHFYAVLLDDDLGEVKAIITRADLLKLLL